MGTAGVIVRKAAPDDLPVIETLIDAGGLPGIGVREHLSTFLVAESGQQVVGVIGLEPYGETGLLRSAAVHPQYRNCGIGTMLYEELLVLAVSLGITRLVLLTNTADRYFARKGFVHIDRSSVTGPVSRSVEFTGACPDHAHCMELVL